jgi:CRISPR-associated endoribonuclease Cas6
MITSLHITCRPEEAGLVPHSTGHILYAGILDAIQRNDPELSSSIHSDQRADLALSTLKGEFDPRDRNRKKVFDDTEYRFSLGLLNTEEAFKPLFKEFVLQDERIALGDVDFLLTELESEEVAFDDLVSREAPERLAFHFVSPTCIDYHGTGVTEMFPHREAVFTSLARSWSNHAPDEYTIQLDPEDLKRHVVEQPDERSYDTHNVIVTRKDRDDGEGTYPIKAFGFTGKVTYSFKNANERLRHKLGILTRWAQYAGIGSHTARGMGNVNVEVEE